MNELSHLVTGGCRSGKSRFALKLAETAERPFFIATAVVGDDDEMRERVDNHRKARGDAWSVIEEPVALGDAIARAKAAGADLIVVDCLTIWTANALFESRARFEAELANLADALKRSNVPVVLVTNEVGCGIVPADSVSREFRDTAGIVNQTIAALVPNVTLTVCGIPTRVKPK
ncbi:MAG: bifunctional adenosylcobinamide kinase/adenosylcobinamide-phosphate guanylyltransferase [Kiritimatiellaeota bacterium]|nr:bifunctional adenosylcobinamide kinase/adenosylcobinamide-phosphate guanylyltransferase [Kiritimatiellota bacterium]